MMYNFKSESIFHFTQKTSHFTLAELELYLTSASFRKSLVYMKDESEADRRK